MPNGSSSNPFCLSLTLPGVPRRTENPRDPKRRLLHLVGGGCAWRLLPHEFPSAGRLSSTTCAPGAWRREVGEGAYRPAQEASASSPEEGPTTERGHSGEPVAQEYRGGRKRARLRWRKKIKGILSA